MMVALVLVAGTPAAAAAIAPNAGCQLAPNDFAGSYVEYTGVASAEVKIESISPLLCTTAGDRVHGSLAWVGVGGPSGCDECIYQIGTTKCVNLDLPSSGCNGTFKLFYAWGRNQANGGCPDVLPVPISLGVAPSGTNTYAVVRTTTLIQFQLNGVTKTTIGNGNICWTRVAAKYYDETYDRGDQMGGTVGDHQSMTNAIYERTVGGSWFSPSFTGCPTTYAFYGCTRVNGQALDIWTDRS